MEYGIRVIFGKFGVGKGVTNSIYALSEMKDEERYENSLLSIENLEFKQERTFSKPPQQHVVFSNYKIREDGLNSYDFDPDLFMLPNDEFPYCIFPPYSTFHVEEGQSGTFNSYDWSSFPKPALLAMARLRHAKYLFTIDLQFITNLNNKLRKFAFEYITPVKLEHEYNCLNMLVKTTVTLGVFRDYDKAVAFETTQNVELFEELRELVFHGCIYDCYDSYSKEDEFFAVESDKDFSYDLAKLKNISNKKVVEIII